jgi:hypothetical protein
MIMTKRNIDWEAIEKEYRAGQISVCAIARQNGITETYVRKRAKKEGWERNLQDRIKKRVREKMVRVREPEKIPVSEETIVEEAASRTLQVIDVHRKVVVRRREAIEAVSDYMENTLQQLDTKELDIFAIKELSIIERNLAGAIDTLVGIERKAYGMDDKDAGEEGQNILIIEDRNSHLKDE